MSEIDHQLSDETIYEFLRRGNKAVISTVSDCNQPEAALINYGVTHDLQLIFETLQTSRKHANLICSPQAALVMGFDDATCQYEGIADRPEGQLLEALLGDYFASHPDGLGHRDWPGLVYFRIRPQWIRISRYGAKWSVQEWTRHEKPLSQHETGSNWSSRTSTAPGHGRWLPKIFNLGIAGTPALDHSCNAPDSRKEH